MSRKTTALPLALLASLAIGVPAGTAVAQPGGRIAQAAGGDAPPLNPAVIGAPLDRLQNALGAAGDAIDGGQGADAARPLRASRRYLIRAYNGAKFLIASQAAPPAEEAHVGAPSFRKLARRVVRVRRTSARSGGGWIRARASQDATGPVFADAPTAVFNVFTSQYQAATTAIGLMPDTTGNLLKRVQATARTAIVLRNRLVKQVAAASPPAPTEDAQAAQEAEEPVTFDVVMPGVSVFLDDEIKQLNAMQQDASVPADVKAGLGDLLAADQQVQTRVNTLWPPVAAD